MRYNSVNKYLKERFGEKIYKIALDGGFTCPNRDGKLGYGGCIFCSAYGSGDYTASSKLSITDQIEEGKKLVAKKVAKDLKAGQKPRYIAYFQAFTSTYGPIEKLRRLFFEAIENEDIAAISIATRPDCLGDEVLDLLKELNEIKPVWVELGLQTIHDSTAKYIRRGYDLPVFDKAVKDLKALGLDQVIIHMIIGLPGESEEMILETVKYIVDSGANGIKLQLLHVLEGTDLAKDYRAGKFECLSLEEYTDIVVKCVSIIPSNMVIHRITGDGDRKSLIAPLWSLEKWKVLNLINKKLDSFNG